MDPINPIAGNPEALNPAPSTISDSLAKPDPALQDSPQTPRDQHWITILSMGLFVIASLAVVAFLYYQNQQLKSMLASYQVTPTPLVSPQPSAEAETANWKTYTDPSNSYSFKYPEGLKSDTGAAGTGFESIRFTFMGQKQIDSGRTQTELSEGYTFIVTKVGPTSGFDPKKEAEKQQAGSTESCKDISNLSKIKINGLDGYSIGCVGESTTIFISDGKNTYSITQFYTGSNKDVYKETTNQILSTFKFIGATSTPSAIPNVVY